MGQIQKLGSLFRLCFVLGLFFNVTYGYFSGNGTYRTNFCICQLDVYLLKVRQSLSVGQVPPPTPPITTPSPTTRNTATTSSTTNTGSTTKFTGSTTTNTGTTSTNTDATTTNTGTTTTNTGTTTTNTAPTTTTTTGTTTSTNTGTTTTNTGTTTTTTGSTTTYTGTTTTNTAPTTTTPYASTPSAAATTTNTGTTATSVAAQNTASTTTNTASTTTNTGSTTTGSTTTIAHNIGKRQATMASSSVTGSASSTTAGSGTTTGTAPTVTGSTTAAGTGLPSSTAAGTGTTKGTVTTGTGSTKSAGTVSTTAPGTTKTTRATVAATTAGGTKKIILGLTRDYYAGIATPDFGVVFDSSYKLVDDYGVFFDSNYSPSLCSCATEQTVEVGMCLLNVAYNASYKDINSTQSHIIVSKLLPWANNVLMNAFNSFPIYIRVLPSRIQSFQNTSVQLFLSVNLRNQTYMPDFYVNNAIKPSLSVVIPPAVIMGYRIDQTQTNCYTVVDRTPPVPVVLSPLYYLRYVTIPLALAIFGLLILCTCCGKKDTFYVRFW